tara:strand:+ start:1009 stop:2418 length:1410 start_codon:yes stop_codon:yes gene_type:complete
MTLQSSGAISLSDIRDEYNTGSNAPIVFNDYYRGGSLVKANAVNNTSTNLSADVPTSANNNPLSVEDFYGQGKGFRRTFNATATNQTGATMFGDDYTLDYPKEIVVDANVTVGATSTSNSAIQISSGLQGTISLTNNGSIEGAGGAASTQGGTALTCSSTVTVVNNGTIKGGGGGGGTGGTGGKGVYTGSATFSSLVDEGGGGSSTPQNNKPTWLNSIYTGAGNLDGVGVVGDRLWGGINAQFNRGINPAEFDINHSGSAGAGFSGNCANRGPIYISAQTNLTGVYSVSASISTSYGSGYGTPTINVSTSNVTSGTSISNSGTVGIASGTTYYFTAYGTTSNNQNYYYNSLSMSVSGSPLVTQNGAAGGAGGVGEGYNQSAGAGASGSSGSNNAGSGGTGGTGGAFGQAGNAGGTGDNGSGTSVTYPATAPTNGASGANGGAAGLAVSGMSNVAGGSLGGSGTTVGGTA